MHHFSAGGLYNGLVLLIDDETESYWDHITGVAVHGPLRGYTLESWPLYHTTAGAAAIEMPDVAVYRVPHRSLIARAMGSLQGKSKAKSGFIPPPFRSTMADGDPRLAERTPGLGVVVDGRARFYPMAALKQPIDEPWGQRTLHIALGERDGTPHATWADDGSLPMQMMARWYGFSFTFPACELFEAE